MKLKELKTMIVGRIALYEEKEKISDDYAEYVDVYVGDCRYIPEGLFEREIMVISGADKLGEGRLEIQLGD